MWRNQLKSFLHILLVTFLSVISPAITGQDTINTPQSVSLDMFGDTIHHWKLTHDTDYPRYNPSEYVKIADKLLAYQNPDGGWPKNIDWLGKLDADSLLNTFSKHDRRSTFDNRNTYPQIEYLSRVYIRTGIERFRRGARRGVSYVLQTQKPSGGWRGWDVDAITFNDDVMTGIMHLLLDVKVKKPYYGWVDSTTRQRISEALDRAITATLKCQIEVNGRKTVWCQQHDHQTYEPVKGRSYELPSKTAWESTSVVEFLMRIPSPTPEIIASVNAAMHWFEDSKLNNIRVKEVKRVVKGEKRTDRIVVQDSTAPPIWARFYEIRTNRPFFCRRSGRKVYSLAEVNYERRIGYDWYGYWPRNLMEEHYQKWRNRVGSIR